MEKENKSGEEYFCSKIQKDWVFAELHIHSRFSRACSKDLTIPNLVKWARVKGVNLLGTGDFTHPIWLSEIKQLREENGVYYYSDPSGEFPFLLTSEISLVFSSNGKGRRVHLIFFAPSVLDVDKINSWLDSLGRRDYDGRPIFNISCRDFVAKMEEINPDIEVVPAHIWTPWFGIFGSKSGFNSLKEAFLDKEDRIHAIETGISSDPEMNWKIPDLENKSILSFSDSHSYWPWRIGREATIFKFKEGEKISYKEIIKQIRENSFIGTIETDPAYGMYHFDGHRNCNFSSDFKETKRLNGICPLCNKPLTIGVEYRVEELGRTNANYKNKKCFFRLLPLHEVISLSKGVGVNSKKTWEIYDKLIKRFSNEYNILINVEKEDLLKETYDEKLTELIILNRIGKIYVKPGYDGVYGKALIDGKEVLVEDNEKEEIKEKKKEKDDKIEEKINLDKQIQKCSRCQQKTLF